jgi:hypothetical protein
LIKRIKAWLRYRREFREQVQFIQGRLWAEEELRSGRMTEEAIFDRCSSPFSNDAFDKGVRNYLYYYNLSAVDPEAAQKEPPWLTKPHSTN